MNCFPLIPRKRESRTGSPFTRGGAVFRAMPISRRILLPMLASFAGLLAAAALTEYDYSSLTGFRVARDLP
jgi:hypothetical protein